MANLIVIYWRDIPAQVMLKQGRKRVRKQLTQRFQEAIDRAAMRAKKTDSDAYLDDWRRDSKPVSVEGTDLKTLLKNAAADLEKSYDDDALLALIRNKGLQPEQPTGG